MLNKQRTRYLKTSLLKRTLIASFFVTSKHNKRKCDFLPKCDFLSKINFLFKRDFCAILLAGIILLSFFGCEFLTNKAPFSDAYYTNNLIGSIGFDVYAGADPQEAADPITGLIPSTTGKWDVGYRANNWESGFNYIALEAVTETGYATVGSSGYGSVPDGLDETATVYRLTVPNLIAPSGTYDKGDFENPNETWEKETDGDTLPTVSIEDDTSTTLSGTTIANITCPKGSYVTYVSKAVDGYTFVNDLSYQVLCDGFCNDQFIAAIETNNLSNQTLTQNETNKTISGNFTFQTGTITTPQMVFSPKAESNFTNLYVDNIQVRRTDGMLLRLRLCPQETTPVLVNGTYSFSVWVHPDYDASVTPDAEPRDLPKIKINIENPPNSTGSLASKSQTYTNPGLSSGRGTWVKITSKLSGKALQFTETTSPVLDLVLDLSNTGSGRILLASPELRFLPD